MDENILVPIILGNNGETWEMHLPTASRMVCDDSAMLRRDLDGRVHRMETRSCRRTPAARRSCEILLTR